MVSAESGSVAVLAEKPSVARDIARVLGAGSKGDGYLHGNGYVVTWAIGHLAALAQPHEINPEWKQWRRNLLPMLPRQWPLVVYEKTKDQFEVVQRILNSPRISQIVCATDAGREGELIFRYIYEAAGCRKAVSRLWISSLTPEAIREGFRRLRDGSEHEPLAAAARGRSRADWLVGMNLSRACTLAHGDELSVGRVQTPTLAMVVERELAIRAFVPEDYLEVVATFAAPDGRSKVKQVAAPRSSSAPGKASAPDGLSYRGTWFRPALPGAAAQAGDGDAADSHERTRAARGPGAPGGPAEPRRRLPPDGEEARRIVARVRQGRARIESLRSETRRMPPPLLYDLTELQRHAKPLFCSSGE